MITRAALISVFSGAVVTAATGQCPPAAPTGVSASNGTQCNGVSITWNAVSGATTYDVFRSTSNNFGSAIRLGGSLNTSMTDLTALPGQTYWYWVVAIRGLCLPQNSFSAPGGPNTGHRGTTPGVPTNFAATSGELCHRVQLTWSPVAGSPSYRVYRNTENNFAESTLIGTTTGGQLVDLLAAPGVEYHYWVVAAALCGTSAPAHTTGYAAGEPRPVLLRVVHGQACRSALLTWEDMPGPLATPATGYTVWRGTVQPQPIPAVPISSPLTVREFVDVHGALPGFVFEYSVVPANACGAGTFVPVNYETRDAFPITGHPQSATVEVGGRATFGVDVPGLPPQNIRWFRDSAPLFGNIPGMSGILSEELAIDPVAPVHAGAYHARIFEPCGGVRDSDPAMLGIACYANCDRSTLAPVLNVDDFTCYINEFAAAQQLAHQEQVVHYANCDGSMVVPALNVDDFTCFINGFALGCE